MSFMNECRTMYLQITPSNRWNEWIIETNNRLICWSMNRWIYLSSKWVTWWLDDWLTEIDQSLVIKFVYIIAPSGTPTMDQLMPDLTDPVAVGKLVPGQPREMMPTSGFKWRFLKSLKWQELVSRVDMTTISGLPSSKCLTVVMVFTSLSSARWIIYHLTKRVVLASFIMATLELRIKKSTYSKIKTL